MTAPPPNPDSLRPDHIEAYLKWYAKLEASQTDTLLVVTERFGKILKKDGWVPRTVRADLRRRLDELRPWRNALCHGAWLSFSGDGAGVLSHYYSEGERIVQFQPRVTVKDLADLRVRIVDATIRIIEVSSVAGSNSALAVVLRRQFEPRNPELE